MATRVTLFAIAFATSILLSRILGPAGKGEYVAVVTLPGMLAALGMLGLPSAVNYYAGRGASLRSLIKAAAIFTVVLSAIMIVVVWVSLPVLEKSILRAAPDNLLRVVLLTIPAGMIASFGGSILYGRRGHGGSAASQQDEPRGRTGVPSADLIVWDPRRAIALCELLQLSGRHLHHPG